MSGLRFFNEPEISQTRDPQLKVPPGGLVLRIFTTSTGCEPANLGSCGEHVTPRPPRYILIIRVNPALSGYLFRQEKELIWEPQHPYMYVHKHIELPRKTMNSILISINLGILILYTLSLPYYLKVSETMRNVFGSHPQ